MARDDVAVDQQTATNAASHAPDEETSTRFNLLGLRLARVPSAQAGK
jgi:hypothetical protein